MQDRNQLLNALEQSHLTMRALVTGLGDEQLQVAYHPGVNPPLWEAGHAAFFYETFVLGLLDGVESIDPSMDELWDSFHVEHRERWSRELFPGRDDTLAYLDEVYRRVRQRIENNPLDARSVYLYRYAIFHQQMHIESMTWCRQTEGYAAPAPACGASPPVSSATDPVAGDVEIPAGRYVIGMPAPRPAYAGDEFAFDNEKPTFEIDLAAFRISRTLTSNAEFLAFVEDDGYRRPEFWSQGGRKWLNRASNNVLAEVDHAGNPPRHPLYWRCKDGQWQQRLFDRWVNLAPDQAVRHISYWEAEAWCRWAGRRLPSEFEWEAAALGNRPGAPLRHFPWDGAMHAERVTMDARALDGLPVEALPAGDSSLGCRQMIGSLWQWTSSHFLPYDGFCVDVYPYMSTLQFGDHMVTRGGSCATSSLLIRGSYRQAYLPERHDVFTSFRSCAL